MNTLSKEFAILPGVMGSCISVRAKYLFSNSLPDFFTEKMAEEAANNIGRMIQMADLKGLDPQTMSIRYDKFDIIAMPVNRSATLLILCDPGSDTSLITTTACMLAPELEKMIEQTAQPVKEPPPAAQSESKESQRYIDKQTTRALTSIKLALFETVGPIADMVYDDCIERWTENNAPDISRIFEFIGYLSGEIDNPELFKEFKEKISSLL